MIGRRGFLELSGSAIAAMSIGGGLEQQGEIEGLEESPDVSGTGVLIGPDENRPEPGSDYFDKFETGPTLLYIANGENEGQRYIIQYPDTDWIQLPYSLPIYETEDLPANPASEGFLVHDKDRGLPAWWDRDHYEFPAFVDDVLIQTNTVSGDVEGTTRTTVWDPSINRDSLIQGRVYQIDLMGQFSTASSSDFFTIDVNLGGTDIAGLQSSKENVSEQPFSVEITFSVRDHGQNGTLNAHSRGLFNSDPDDTNFGNVTVDTTTITAIEVDVTLSEANAGNVVELDQAHLKQMG